MLHISIQVLLLKHLKSTELDHQHAVLDNVSVLTMYLNNSAVAALSIDIVKTALVQPFLEKETEWFNSIHQYNGAHCPNSPLRFQNTTVESNDSGQHLEAELSHSQ